jgi:hypothetical protein
MKKILTIVLLSIMTISFGCKKCKNEDPRARVINNGTTDVSVQIKTSGGNTENINNIKPGTSSDFRSYAAGTVTFTISISNNSNFVKTVEMEECFEYDIAIDASNNIVSTPTDRNE